MTRIAFDTNILVSALLSPDGNKAKLIQAFTAGKIQMCASSQTFTEYRDVLGRSKFDHVRAGAKALVAVIQNSAAFVPVMASGHISPDPGDTCFLDCAFAAAATFLVTGRKRHFPQQFYGGTEIVNAAEVIRRLDSLTP